MSPPTTASLLDAALGSIAVFLHATGLEGAAGAVEAARGEPGASCPHSIGAASISAAVQLKAIAASLELLGGCCPDRSTALRNAATGGVSCSEEEAPTASQMTRVEECLGQEKGQEWLDQFLRNIAQSDIHKMIDSSLSTRLEQVLAEPSCRVDCGGVGALGREICKPSVKGDDVAGSLPAPGLIIEAGDDSTAALQMAKPPSLSLPPSEHYAAARRGANYDPDIPEEYRDDNDPGYRIREVMEVELVAALQEKYSMVMAPPSQDAQSGSDRPLADQVYEAAEPSSTNTGDVVIVSACDATMSIEHPGGGDDDELLGASSAGEAHSADMVGSPTSPSGSIKDFVKNAGSKVLAVLGMGDKEGSAIAVAPEEVEAPIGMVSAQLLSADSAQLQPEEQRQEHQQQQPAVAQAPAPSYASAQNGTVSAASAAQTVAMPHALACRRKERSRNGKPACRYADSGDPFYPVDLDGITYDSFSLRVVYERDRTGFEESKEFPIKINSIIGARYQVLEYLGSAAFSRAVQCLDLQTNRMVCMKIIKNDKDFLDQSLDEIKLLKIINANCVDVDQKHCLGLIDYFYHKEHLIIVTELLRDNLYEFSKFNRECGEEPYFTLGRLQRIAKQVLVALDYIHSLLLIHADLKPENILVKSYSRCEVKVIDFGSSCFVDDQLTSYVQSRSYRAPEVMLGLPYSQKIDVWSLGCIIAELWTGYVLFQNDSVQSLLARIIGIIGPFPMHMLATGRFVPQYFTQDGQLYREPDTAAGGPNTPLVPERRVHLLLPKKSSLKQRMRSNDEVFIDFLAQFLQLDPAKRPTAAEALRHPWLESGRYIDGIQ